jgi:hypothetical protein
MNKKLLVSLVFFSVVNLLASEVPSSPSDALGTAMVPGSPLIVGAAAAAVGSPAATVPLTPEQLKLLKEQKRIRRAENRRLEELKDAQERRWRKSGFASDGSPVKVPSITPPGKGKGRICIGGAGARRVLDKDFGTVPESSEKVSSVGPNAITDNKKGKSKGKELTEYGRMKAEVVARFASSFLKSKE